MRGESNVRVACAVAAWLAATLCLVEPLQSLVENFAESSIGFGVLLLRALPVALFVFVAALAVLLASFHLAPRFAPAVAVALCVLLFAQVDLLLWNYGLFDGSPIDWSRHVAKGWLEVVAWLLALGFALVRPDWLRRRALAVLGMLAVLQVAGLAASALDNAPYEQRSASPRPAAALLDDFATLSSERNAIVVVLDMAQSDLFAEALQTASLADATPEGFVYYRNAVSLYTITQFSLQSILTSRAIPDHVDGYEFRDAAMRGSVPALLAAQGFQSRLVTFAPDKLACPRRIRGVHCARPIELAAGQGGFETWRVEMDLLFRLGLFRAAPHFLKPRVYDAGEWRIAGPYGSRAYDAKAAEIHEATRTDLAVLSDLTSHLKVKAAPPRFRFLHLNGVHHPASIDAQCEQRAGGTSREQVVETMRCMLRSLFGFFDAIERSGVYDQTLLIVVADHGHPRLPIDATSASPPIADVVTEGGDLDDFQRGVPLFLVKELGARGALRVSDRPVSLCDVPATIFDALNMNGKQGFACESVRTPRRSSPRLHFRYPSGPEQERRPRRYRYVFEFEPFEVDGHSWLPGSWKRLPLRPDEIVTPGLPASPGSPD